MSEDYAIQFSVKTPRDSLLNLRANTPDEFQAAVQWALSNAARFVDLETAIKGVPAALAANVTVTSVQPNNIPQPSYNVQPTNEPPQGPPPPSCMHGPMNYKTGNKNGKTWQGYFCPESGSDCKPQWIK